MDGRAISKADVLKNFSSSRPGAGAACVATTLTLEVHREPIIDLAGSRRTVFSSQPASQLVHVGASNLLHSKHCHLEIEQSLELGSFQSPNQYNGMTR